MIIFFDATFYSSLIGLVFLILGEIIRLIGVAYAGEITRTTKRLRANFLVTNGPYAYVRNPIYLGNIMIYIGYGIISLALFPYLQIVAISWFIFQYHVIIHLEEEFLEDKYGEAYLAYKNKVNRYLPKIKSYTSEFNRDVVPNYLEAIKSEVPTFQSLISVGLISVLFNVVFR